MADADPKSQIQNRKSDPRNRLTLPKKLHVRAKSDYDAVFDARKRVVVGPLAYHVRRQDLRITRFGMSVSRKVGTAVQRNRIRRKLREAFRLLQHELPVGYDIVAVVRPHAPLDLAEYQRMLQEAMRKVARK